MVATCDIVRASRMMRIGDWRCGLKVFSELIDELRIANESVQVTPRVVKACVISAA